MFRLISVLFALSLAITACTPAVPTVGSDGQPRAQLYRINRGDAGKIQFRMLDSVNALRSASGAGDLALNSQLTAAAATHSRDMSAQNRPWHFGSDGSSPIERVQRTGYSGLMLGENISETYETELETLGAWMEKPDTRRVIMDPEATDLGFSWYQESNGKIWWTLITGRR